MSIMAATIINAVVNWLVSTRMPAIITYFPILIPMVSDEATEDAVFIHGCVWSFK